MGPIATPQCPVASYHVLMAIRPRLMNGTDLGTAAFACAALLGFDERCGTWEPMMRKTLETLLDESAKEQIARREIAASDKPIGPSREE
jgi:hypothetical protein